MNEKILVTGACGNVGRYVVTELLNKNCTVVVAEYDIENAKKMYLDKVKYVKLDFMDSTTYEQAFEGISSVFLMRPPQIDKVKKYINPAIEVAIKCGVKHFTLLSIIGSNPMVPHYKIERYLLANKDKITYTFLRASFFMQNLITSIKDEIVSRNEIYVPAGNGKTSFIDCRDIAKVAAITLTEMGHENKIYELTGSESLSYFEVADIMSKVLNRSIKYVNPKAKDFKNLMISKGHPKDYAFVTKMIYTTAKIGLAKKVTNTFKELTNTEPITLEQFTNDFKDVWKNE